VSLVEELVEDGTVNKEEKIIAELQQYNFCVTERESVSELDTVLRYLQVTCYRNG